MAKRKKEITAVFKVQAKGGQATPAPPVGPACGQYGVNPGQFVMQFNDRTKALNGMPVTAVVTVYADKSFEFVVKSPPAAVLLKDAAKIEKGSGIPNKEKVGKVTHKQLLEIAKVKQKDLNCFDLEAGARIIAGTARNMGIEIVEA
ncbi:MAG: 50S ribosomal protein L11 [Phycisphaerae bacterium]|nr:50S ribosomal protein L11 [Phycisphaerae bacterium]NUQ45619.1 50S ribosomal protein L11 [Phycisphaerae bacterium]